MCQIAQLVLKLLLFRDLWKISRQLYISLLMLDRMWVGKLLDFHIFINHGSTRYQWGEQTLLSAPLEEVERSCLKKTKKNKKQVIYNEFIVAGLSSDVSEQQLFFMLIFRLFTIFTKPNAQNFIFQWNITLTFS